MIFFTDLVKICDEVLCNCQLELPLLARDWGHSGAKRRKKHQYIYIDSNALHIVTL